MQVIPSYYIHTEIYILKSCRVNFRSQTDVNQSNVAYRFSHMWEKRYVQSGATYNVFSRVSRTASWSFHSRLVGAVLYTAQAIALPVWREPIVFIRISSIVNIESSCLGESHVWKVLPKMFSTGGEQDPVAVYKIYRERRPENMLFKTKVVSLKQEGGGKEFELRSQALTKQPWTQISQLYFISFGFYLSSFAFYEAAFFQWLLFDHICLNKACHNLMRVFNLSMYITNIIPHEKCFVRCLHTPCFVSEISLVRFTHLFDFWYATTRV